MDPESRWSSSRRATRTGDGEARGGVGGSQGVGPKEPGLRI